MCGGHIGKQDRICFEDSDACTVTAHRHSRLVELQPGIYVKASATAHSQKVVFLEPIGSLDLLPKYVEFLMTHQATGKQHWIKIFKILETAQDYDDAMMKLGVEISGSEDTTLEAGLGPDQEWDDFDYNSAPTDEDDKKPNAASKTVEEGLEDTPGVKREEMMTSFDLPDAARARLNKDEEALVEDVLISYEEVIHASAKAQGFVLVDGERDITISKIVKSAYAMAINLIGAVQEVHEQLSMERACTRDSLASMDETAKLVKSRLRKCLKKPDYMADIKGETVWDAVNHLSVLIKDLPDKVDLTAFKAEQEALEKDFENFNKEITKTLLGYKKSIDAIDISPSAKLEEKLSELKKEFSEMVEDCRQDGYQEADKVDDRLKIVEEQLTKSKECYEIDAGVTLYSVEDVVSHFSTYTDWMNDFGAFTDLYGVAERIYQMMCDALSSDQLVKGLSNAKQNNLSMDEVIIIKSHGGSLPSIFSCNSKPNKSEIANLETYKHWRNRSQRNGLADHLEEFLPTAIKEQNHIIDSTLGYHSLTPLRHMAKELLAKAASFLKTLIAWVDESYITFCAGGNTEKDSWWIITFVIKSLFTRYLAPARVCSHRAKFESDERRAGEFIWSAIKSYNAISHLEEIGIKDHPIVMGALSEWLVQNSGRKEAMLAQSEVERLNALVKEQQKVIAELQASVRGAKSTADKALSKANGGGGKSSGN